MTLFQHLVQSFNVIAPILVILVLGHWFRKKNWVDANFVSIGNRLTFNLLLPSLLFLATATRPFSRSEDLPLAVFAVISTIITVFLVWLIAPYLVEAGKRGAFTQSAFRSNMGLIGLALCINAYGEGIVARASLFIASMIIAVNVLSIMVLTQDRRHILRNQLRNPLIIAIVAGIAWQKLQIPMPTILETSLGYFARMALPFALLCIGASIEWKKLEPGHIDVAWAAALKMIIIPVAITAAAVWWGFRGEDLGILFLMIGAPTATVAFVMARELTPHGNLAAESIALTTLISPLTITAGLAVLSYLGLI